MQASTSGPAANRASAGRDIAGQMLLRALNLALGVGVTLLLVRVLGTDGFGRSDYRKRLRFFFEVDRHFVAVAALKALADENKIPSVKVAEAMKRYGINPEKPIPTRV